MKNPTVQTEIANYVKQGWSKNQATSLAWAEYFSDKMNQIENRYQGNFSPDWTFICKCETCGPSANRQFINPDSVRLYIREHEGHKTKTNKVNGLNGW